ncbi:MAG: hypothetical protein AABY54_07260, partial [Deltaproteobacteria bacterium]
MKDWSCFINFQLKKGLTRKIYSSTLFECGFAYRKQTKSLYFVKSLTELPFLMRHLADASPFISIMCEKNYQEFINKIKTDKIDIFSSAEEC